MMPSPHKSTSAVAQAAEKLRRFSMSRKEGEFLGSEEDLIERLRVSRPTLRQASAQVLQENLISVRRGVGGGYFARLPDSMAVSRMAALFLKSSDVDLATVLQVMRPLRTEIAGLAAANRDADAIAALRQFLEHEELTSPEAHEQTYRDFLRSERDFGRVIGILAGNPVLMLFLYILYDLVPLLRRDEDVLVNHPERVRAYREQRLKMARAILEGDEEIARVASRRCSDLIIDWLHADSDHFDHVYDSLLDGGGGARGAGSGKAVRSGKAAEKPRKGGQARPLPA